MKNQTVITEEAREAVSVIRSNTKLLDNGSGGYDSYKVFQALSNEFTTQEERKEAKRAVNKRRRELKDRLTALVGNALKEFENRYMNAYTEWSMQSIISTAEKYSDCNSNDELYDKLKGKTLAEVGIEPRRRFETSDTLVDKGNHCYRIWREIKMARNKMEIESLTRFEFMSEAAKGYARKFENLINKMVDYDFSTRFLKVEEVNNAGDELSFLITNDERAIHARAIFVNGAIKAPHYRFITTERKK